MSAMRDDGLAVQGPDETIEVLGHENDKPSEAVLSYFTQ
jgi:hypothetical protein